MLNRSFGVNRSFYASLDSSRKIAYPSQNMRKLICLNKIVIKHQLWLFTLISFGSEQSVVDLCRTSLFGTLAELNTSIRYDISMRLLSYPEGGEL